MPGSSCGHAGSRSEVAVIVVTRHSEIDAACRCPFLVRAIAVRREVIRSPDLRTDKVDLYRFFVGR